MSTQVLSENEMVKAVNEFSKNETIIFIDEILPLLSDKKITTIIYSYAVGYILIGEDGTLYMFGTEINNRRARVMAELKTETKIREYNVWGTFNDDFKVVTSTLNKVDSYGILSEATKSSGGKWGKTR